MIRVPDWPPHAEDAREPDDRDLEEIRSASDEEREPDESDWSMLLWSDPVWVWQAVNEYTVAQWVLRIHKGEELVAVGPTAILVYTTDDEENPINKRLRLPTSRLVFDTTSAIPTWSARRQGAPDQLSLEMAWEESKSARAKLARRQKRAATSTEVFERKGTETPERFYLRVANFYKAAAASSGRPVVKLAEAAGVPRSTASQWVFQARARGYLPMTQRGRARG